MKLIVFTGPTLPPADAKAHLQAEYRPPAAIGDVYKAALQRPFAIGIIDGYYETTPSIWHKEVLWALAQGIHVYGAASMGALRAAELAAFGMTGVGKVYESYRDQVIEDDDEVAVLHSPAEMGYLQITEAMVNIRATLTRATEAQIIDEAAEKRLVALGRIIFWKERSYDRLLTEAAHAGFESLSIERLRAWLPAHKINQKRADAIAMLERMKADAAASPGPLRPRFVFQHTVAWDAIQQRFAAADDGGEAIDREELLDELRLTPGAYGAVRRKVLLSRMEQDEFEPTTAQLQNALRDFRRAQGLATPAALERWMQGQGHTRESFLRLMADEARLTSLEASLAGAMDAALLDELRRDGIYAQLLTRVRDKQAALSGLGLNDAGIGDTGLDEAALIDWFRKRSDGSDAPEDADLALSLGFQSKADLLRALAREYCFQQQRQA